MPPIIAFDSEQYYDDIISVKPLGYWKYFRHPGCEKYLISVCDGKESWAGTPDNFNFDSLNGAILLSHNRAHDEECALAAVEAGEWPSFKPAAWHCTASMSAYLWNVRSLKDACKVGLGIDLSKGTRDKAKGKHWADIVREGWADEMLTYARSDAQYPHELWTKYSDQWPEIERRLSDHTITSGRYGVRIDVPALLEGIKLLERVVFTAEQNLPWVKRGRKPGSTIGIAEECRTHNIPTPPVKADDPDAAEAWEEEYSVKFPFVMALKNTRKAKKMLATLNTIKLRLRDDETVATNLKYCGAHTRRWAGDGGWNLQNPNREPLFIDSAYSFVYDKFEIVKLVEQFKEQPLATGVLPSGRMFLDLRGLIIPRPGKKLIAPDLSQIEPRVLNWLATRLVEESRQGNSASGKLLQLIRDGYGVYESFARANLGWTGGKLKDEDPNLYKLAKADVLGGGFGAGWEKFITVAWTMAQVDLTEGDLEFALAASVDQETYRRIKHNGKWHYEAAPEGIEVLRAPPEVAGEWSPCVFVRRERINYKTKEKYVEVVPLGVYGMRARVTIDTFRKTSPEVVGLWKHLDEGFKASVGGNFELQSPNGDKMIYRNIRRSKRKKVDPDSGEEYDQNAYTAEVGGKRKVFYGGKLAENITQMTARHVFAERTLDLEAQLAAEDPSQRVLFTVHDEAVAEVNDPGPDPKAQKALEKRVEVIFSVCPDWLPGCPIGSEAKLLNRYAK